jgi:hypothetical protein
MRRLQGSDLGPRNPTRVPLSVASCWCGRLPIAPLCQNEFVEDLRDRRPPMDQIIRIGMDTSKHVSSYMA